MKLVILDNGRINIVAETPMDRAFLRSNYYFNVADQSLGIKAVSYTDKDSGQMMVVVCPDRGRQVGRPDDAITCPSCNGKITDAQSEFCRFCSGKGWVVIADPPEKKTKSKKRRDRRMSKLKGS